MSAVSRWRIHGERSIYSSPWVGLSLAEVDTGDGHRFEHHVLHFGTGSASLVVADPGRGVLMLYRHRFITDTWGWEVPSGRLEQGEAPADGAAREAVEETGWRPGPLQSLGVHYPLQGLADIAHHVFLARSAVLVGEPEDRHESSRVEWLSWERVLDLMRDGNVPDGFTQLSLLSAMAFGGVRDG
jgi:8-oxo-dGTP pyrophosphatase MutT (NUDIX family)